MLTSATDARYHRWDRSAEYQYDAASNRTWMRTSDDPATSWLDPIEVSYSHDAADQLLVENKRYLRRVLQITRGYDGNGNLITESAQNIKHGKPRGDPKVETFVYNLADDLIADGPNRWKRDGRQACVQVCECGVRLGEIQR